jgi:prepilin-type N-terminal cleavage/methylation domain-containing protein
MTLHHFNKNQKLRNIICSNTNILRNGAGFTLIEVLISIFIVALLASLFTVGIDFYKRQELENQAQNLLEVLRRAQSKAISVESDSSFGVYLTSGNYTLFKGQSYSQRDSQYDEVYNLPAIIKIEGLSEIVFLKTEGVPKEIPAYCGGNCTSCDQFSDKTSCLAQDGCSWNAKKKVCEGTCTPCNSYQNQTDCQAQSGCVWYPATKGGNIILRINNESRTININEMGRINLQ